MALSWFLEHIEQSQKRLFVLFFKEKKYQKMTSRPYIVSYYLSNMLRKYVLFLHRFSCCQIQTVWIQDAIIIAK